MPFDPRSASVSPYTSWLSKVSDTDVVVAPLGAAGGGDGGHGRLRASVGDGPGQPAALPAGVEEHDRGG